MLTPMPFAPCWVYPLWTFQECTPLDPSAQLYINGSMAKDPKFQRMNFCSVIRGSQWKG